MINKIVRKSMRKKLGLLIAIFVLIVLSAAFVGVRYLTYDTLQDNYTQMKEQSNVEDFRMYTIPAFADQIDDDLINQMEEDENLELEKREKIIYSSQELDTMAFGIYNYDANNLIDTLIIDDGELPVNKGEVVVLPAYLDHINKSIGDNITIGDNEYTISGTVYIPDYIIPVEYSLGMFAPNFDAFAPVYMNQESFDEIDISDSRYTHSIYITGQFNDEVPFKDRNDIYTRINDNYQIEVPKLDANGVPQFDLETGEMITDSYPYIAFTMDVGLNTNISGVEQEVAGSRSMYSFLSKILTFLTIALAIVLVNSVFKGQRREMGILKAEGVSIGKLSFGFSLYISILVVIGSIVGLMLSIPMANAMLEMYTKIFQIFEYPIEKSVLINATFELIVIGILVVFFVYLFSIRKNLRQPTLNLVKNINSDKEPKRNVTKLFSRLSFLRKYQLNIIFRNFSKTLLLFFGILVSSFLLLLGALMYTTVDEMMNNIYFEVFDYQFVVNYSDGVSIEENNNTYIDMNAELVGVPDEASLDEPLEDETIKIQSYEMGETDYVHLKDRDGEVVNVQDGLLATEGFMKNYNLEIGDTITVVNPYDENEEVDLEIVATTPDFFLPFVFGDNDYIQESFGLDDDYVNSEYFGDPLTDEKKQEILDTDPNAFIFETIDMQKQMESSMGIFLAAIAMIATFAGIIAFISLYTISHVIIDSNRKTISVMKVLGYTDQEIKKMTIGMYKWFVIVIYLMLLPGLEFAIQGVINFALRDAGFSIFVQINRVMALLGLLVIFVVYIIASSLTFRKIKKIRLAESLKADE